MLINREIDKLDNDLWYSQRMLYFLAIKKEYTTGTQNNMDNFFFFLPKNQSKMSDTKE